MVLGAPAAGGYRGGIFDPLEGNQKRMSHKDVCTGYLGPGLPGRSQKRSRKVQFDGFMCEEALPAGGGERNRCLLLIVCRCRPR